MIIPHTEIAADTLQTLIEECVTRDGTDYGEHEVSTARKVQQVMEQLERKEIYIVYSELLETCTLQTKETISNYKGL
ncbi:MAG: hypothetical protein COC05_02270 [Gammaproteobacteria bacterium]|nr:MAG: hypothetical protein COC05_02270 [Gammaproteobacteria bacterium]